MNFNTQKLLGGLLLFVTVIPALILSSFWIKQYVIQYQMEKRLETTMLHTIILNKAAVKWIRQEKEVEINGRLFDVKKISTTDNIITITGLFDEEEQLLENKASGLLKSKSNDNFPFSQLLIKFVSVLAEPHSDIFKIDTACYTINKVYPFYKEKENFQTKGVIIQPPNI
jgi:hypothetical protein